MDEIRLAYVLWHVIFMKKDGLLNNLLGYLSSRSLFSYRKKKYVYTRIYIRCSLTIQYSIYQLENRVYLQRINKSSVSWTSKQFTQILVYYENH